ncbi:DUF4132 domain-containing protein [Corallincola spongiicola]|uniref:DUF4132 domain-containing protein n=1 Tax=Corallincola spongiicola TaxID=2520508 RepID=A0ABY1WRV8_9GAMM|nr:DUF4132 domain-containing protein [Corallincola spongiicola]TAA47472.1 DUF4132 domain-containing protein [Corallincola spongiicola]
MEDSTQLDALALKLGQWGLHWLPAHPLFGNSLDLRTRRLKKEDPDRLPELFKDAAEAITAEFGKQALMATAAFYCTPKSRGLPLIYSRDKQEESRVHSHLLTICEGLLVLKGDTHSNAILMTRLKGQLTRSLPIENCEALLGGMFNHFSFGREAEYGYLKPTTTQLCEMLAECWDPATDSANAEALLNSEWNSEFEWIDNYDEKEQLCSYQIHDYALQPLILKSVYDAIAKDAFSYEAYCQLADLDSYLVMDDDFMYHNDDGKLSQPLSAAQAALYGYMQQWTWQRYQALDLPVEMALGSNDDAYRYREKQLRSLTHCSDFNLPGARWLVQTCEHIERLGLGAKQVNADSYDKLSRLLYNFARFRCFEADENVEQLAVQLKKFKPATLWLLLPFAGKTQKAILNVLEAESLIPLIEFIALLVRDTPYNSEPQIHTFDNSESETCGVVDLHAFHAAVKDLPAKLITTYFKSLKGSKLGYTRAIYLCEAILGNNQKVLEKSIDKHNQIAVKALGLLPINTDQDAVKRYTTLRQVWKECSKYGAERQANTRAAVTVGLKNLAQTAGYPDVARLEWDMESKLSEANAQLLSEQSIGDWTVKVDIIGLKSNLQVHKDGKQLKSVPAGLRKFAEYTALREQMKELDDQARRFKQALENMMCMGEILSPETLSKLAQIASVNCLLANLVGIDNDGQLGLINATEATLTSLNGKLPIQGDLRIAHVEDLYKTKLLSEWQRALVEIGRVQPFKQLFRELYVPTPAELDSSPKSHRYSGRTISTSVGYRLLQSRGWNAFGGEGDCVCRKLFASAGIHAYWSFPEVHHFFSEDEVQVADVIEFFNADGAMAIADVPSRLFSEVMRDADLVASVAVVDDDGAYWSAELSASRIDVVREVMAKLGFDNLSFDGHFVYVQGKRAKYRIHLGSGNIHIMPGAYLCIVPQSDRKAKPIYLPFAESDRKATEVISKAILLSDDDRISDDTITQQIDAAVKA